MKIRSIRPEFFADPKMVELTPYARVLYMGLWCYVDDEGRGEFLPKRIEGDVFPLEDVDFKGLWGELEGLGRVVRYQVGGHEYFRIPTFERWQKPNRRYESKLPAPPLDSVDAARTQRVDTALVPLVEGEVEVEVEVEGVVAPDGARTTLSDLKAALVELFGEPPPQNWKLYNRIATWIRDQGGTVEDVRLKAGLIAEEWGRKALTATSLEKYWTRYDAQVGQLSDADVKKYQAEVRRLQRRKEITDGA